MKTVFLSVSFGVHSNYSGAPSLLLSGGRTARCHMAAWGQRSIRGSLTCLMGEGLVSSCVARVMHRSVLVSACGEPSTLISSPPHSTPLHSLQAPLFLILNLFALFFVSPLTKSLPPLFSVTPFASALLHSLFPAPLLSVPGCRQVL